MSTLDDRTKELIAVGASVTANCLPCLEFHTSKARENGASPDEIREAVEVGRLVRKGAAAKLDRLAAGLTDGVPETRPQEGCGCS